MESRDDDREAEEAEEEDTSSDDGECDDDDEDYVDDDEDEDCDDEGERASNATRTTLVGEAPCHNVFACDEALAERMGVSTNALRALARRSGVRKCRRDVHETLKSLICNFVHGVVQDACLVDPERMVLRPDAVCFALQRRGMKVYSE